jgi:hypothetical protein
LEAEVRQAVPLVSAVDCEILKEKQSVLGESVGCMCQYIHFYVMIPNIFGKGPWITSLY